MADTARTIAVDLLHGRVQLAYLAGPQYRSRNFLLSDGPVPLQKQDINLHYILFGNGSA